MKVGRIILRLSGVLTLAIAWQIAGHTIRSPALPPLDRVLWALFYFVRDGTFARHAGASLSIILYGIGVAVSLGFALGLMMFRYSNFKTAVSPIIEAMRGLSALTLFPLLIVISGLGTFSRVFVIFWTAWPAVVLSVVAGLDVDKNVVDAAKMDGAGEWRVILNIRIPMAAREIITGIRIGVGGGWIGLVAAEMLGATKGLGYYLLWSAQSFEFAKVYAVIITIAAIGGMMNFALSVLQKKLLNITGGSQ